MTARVQVRSATPADAPAVARIHWESWRATYRGVFPQQAFDEFPLAKRETLWEREATRHGDAALRRQLLVAELGVEPGTEPGTEHGTEHGARIAGFASVGPYRVQAADDSAAALDGELFAIYVDPPLARTGIGRALWSASSAWLHGAGFDALRLWCVAGNPAEAFYRAMGASQVGASSFALHGTPLRENCYRAATH